MTSLTIKPQWHDEINQVEKTEAILGGAGGNANLATKQLAESLFWLKEQLENNKAEAYKVGDIYTTTINHADANAVKAHHGYGTWKRYAEGRTLVGFSTQSTELAEYKTMGTEFGENAVKLTIDEMPSHSHEFWLADGTGASEQATASSQNMTTTETGGDQPHNNIQPSIVVAYWLRTA